MKHYHIIYNQSKLAFYPEINRKVVHHLPKNP